MLSSKLLLLEDFSLKFDMALIKVVYIYTRTHRHTHTHTHAHAYLCFKGR